MPESSPRISRPLRALKSKGEMSEWLKEHAWKTIVVTLAKRY
jgi:hypothetical protein